MIVLYYNIIIIGIKYNNNGNSNKKEYKKEKLNPRKDK